MPISDTPVITTSAIEELFKHTNFGGQEKTEAGRLGLMVECVLKRASGFSDGSTITSICMKAGLLPDSLKPTQSSIRWAFLQIYKSNAANICERLEAGRNAAW